MVCFYYSNMAEKRKKAMDFSAFGLEASKKKPPKKEAEPLPTFEDDPIEIHDSLQEVANATRSELNHLAKQYTLSGAAQIPMEELRDALYQKIRSGATKILTAFEEYKYVEWKYKCNCESAKKAIGKVYNVTIKMKEGRDPPIKKCPYCREIMEAK